MSRHNSLGLEVCFTTHTNEVIPECQHGPAVLFERYTQAGRSPERFFACSASRDRKFCSFFQRMDEGLTPGKKKGRNVCIQKKDYVSLHKHYQIRNKTFKVMDVSDRIVCLSCGLLLLHGEESKHKKHSLRTAVSDKELMAPSKLLTPLDNNKTNAQYLFSAKTTQFIVKTALSLKYKKILCIGTPRIHEEVICNHHVNGIKSLLLDIDHRFEQFYSPECFQSYNMFNNHLFGGEKSKQLLWKFLLEDTGPVLIIVDPPFGGMAELLAHTLKQLSLLWREVNSIEENKLVHLFWFFPYFLEGKVLESLPGIAMLDYKVEYENHTAYKQCSKTGKSKQGSAVRIFTNIDPATVVLPKKDGYRICKLCQRYVSQENVHCVKCGACTSKDGKTYRHCDKCQRCVKPRKEHCDKCGVCDIPDRHSCDTVKATVCHLCSATGHKRKDCPLRKQQIDSMSSHETTTLTTDTSHKPELQQKASKKKNKKHKRQRKEDETKDVSAKSKRRKVLPDSI